MNTAFGGYGGKLGQFAVYHIDQRRHAVTPFYEPGGAIPGYGGYGAGSWLLAALTSGGSNAQAAVEYPTSAQAQAEYRDVQGKSGWAYRQYIESQGATQPGDILIIGAPKGHEGAIRTKLYTAAEHGAIWAAITKEIGAIPSQKALLAAAAINAVAQTAKGRGVQQASAGSYEAPGFFEQNKSMLVAGGIGIGVLALVLVLFAKQRG